MPIKIEKITREELEAAMKTYLSKGGKIHVLPYAPDNLIQQVGHEHSAYDDIDSFSFLDTLKVY